MRYPRSIVGLMQAKLGQLPDEPQLSLNRQSQLQALLVQLPWLAKIGQTKTWKPEWEKKNSPTQP